MKNNIRKWLSSLIVSSLLLVSGNVYSSSDIHILAAIRTLSDVLGYTPDIPLKDIRNPLAKGIREDKAHIAKVDAANVEAAQGITITDAGDGDSPWGTLQGVHTQFHIKGIDFIENPEDKKNAYRIPSQLDKIGLNRNSGEYIDAKKLYEDSRKHFTEVTGGKIRGKIIGKDDYGRTLIKLDDDLFKKLSTPEFNSVYHTNIELVWERLFPNIPINNESPVDSNGNYIPVMNSAGTSVRYGDLQIPVNSVWRMFRPGANNPDVYKQNLRNRGDVGSNNIFEVLDVPLVLMALLVMLLSFSYFMRVRK